MSCPQYPKSVDLISSPFNICLSMRHALMMRFRAAVTVALSSDDLKSRARQSGQAEFCKDSINKHPLARIIRQFTLSRIQAKRLIWWYDLRRPSATETGVCGNYNNTQLFSAEYVSACLGEACDPTVFDGLGG